MKIRLAKKIMKHSRWKPKDGIDLWHFRWLSWNRKIYNVNNAFIFGLYVPAKIDHRITKAISLTSKKKHDKSKAKG